MERMQEELMQEELSLIKWRIKNVKLWIAYGIARGAS